MAEKPKGKSHVAVRRTTQLQLKHFTTEVILRGHPDGSAPTTARLSRSGDPLQPLQMDFAHLVLAITFSREEMAALRDFIDEILAEG